MHRRAPPARGILSLGRRDGRLLETHRIEPTDALAPFVHHFFFVEWDLRAPFTSEALPHPSARIVIGAGGHARVAGVRRSRFSKTLAGKGRVFGVAFRPAAFQPTLGASMAALTDRSVPLERLFGEASRAWAKETRAARGVDDAISIAERFLFPRVVALPTDVARIRDVVERAMHDRSLRRAEDLATALDLDVRTLQRRFSRCVGVSPKWVVQRYRMHEAAERLRSDDPPALATLAADLGYADQSHFARDFKNVVGRTPRTFRVAMR